MRARTHLLLALLLRKKFSLLLDEHGLVLDAEREGQDDEECAGGDDPDRISRELAAPECPRGGGVPRRCNLLPRCRADHVAEGVEAVAERLVGRVVQPQCALELLVVAVAQVRAGVRERVGPFLLGDDCRCVRARSALSTAQTCSERETCAEGSTS